MENKKELQLKEEALGTYQQAQEDPNKHVLNSEEAYWEAVIDPENEDEIIFDLCLLEELEDILEQGVKQENAYAAHELLPLDFLPIVAEEATFEENNHVPAPDKEWLLDIDVTAEIIHEDEKFAVELDRILQRIRTSDKDELEEITIDFIPLVVPAEEAAIDEDLAAKTNEFEVVYEEIAHAEAANEREDQKESTEVTLTTKDERVDATEETATEEDLAVKLHESEVVNEAIESKDAIIEKKEQKEGEEAVVNTIAEIFAEEVSKESGNTESTAINEAIAFNIDEDLEERVSIFNELFRTCDAESKLILLDEILAVGDERDLKFFDHPGPGRGPES